MTRSLTTPRIAAAWFFVATILLISVLFVIPVAGSGGTMHGCLELQLVQTARMPG
ncbi:MAG: hypothetical protein P1U77_07015 [Rubripirellula sp.]|nr:hypothetical protein [Rubripirellula sp.]